MLRYKWNIMPLGNPPTQYDGSAGHGASTGNQTHIGTYEGYTLSAQSEASACHDKAETITNHHKHNGTKMTKICLFSAPVNLSTVENGWYGAQTYSRWKRRAIRTLTNRNDWTRLCY